MVGAQLPDKGKVGDLTTEFTERQEGLKRMELCLTELEKRPGDGELLSEIFRMVHTIQGTTGFPWVQPTAGDLPLSGLPGTSKPEKSKYR